MCSFSVYRHPFSFFTVHELGCLTDDYVGTGLFADATFFDLECEFLFFPHPFSFCLHLPPFLSLSLSNLVIWGKQSQTDLRAQHGSGSY